MHNILNNVNVIQGKNFNISEASETLNNLKCFLKEYRSDKGFNDTLADNKELTPFSKSRNFEASKKVPSSYKIEHQRIER